MEQINTTTAPVLPPPDDNTRMWAALDLAANRPVWVSQDAFRHHRTPTNRTVVLRLAVVVLAAVGLSELAVLTTTGSSQVAPWRISLSDAVSGVAMGIGLVLLLVLMQAARVAPGGMRWLLVLTVAQRRSVRRQSEGLEPAHPVLLPLAMQLAVYNVRTGWEAWVFVPVSAVFAALAIGTTGVTFWIFRTWSRRRLRSSAAGSAAERRGRSRSCGVIRCQAARCRGGREALRFTSCLS